jgi:hypothetical protein
MELACAEMGRICGTPLPSTFLKPPKPCIVLQMRENKICYSLLPRNDTPVENFRNVPRGTGVRKAVMIAELGLPSDNALVRNQSAGPHCSTWNNFTRFSSPNPSSLRPAVQFSRRHLHMINSDRVQHGFVRYQLQTQLLLERGDQRR